MFLSCGSLESLEVSHFFTSQVKSMKYMFASCSSLITLDLSSFDTSWVEDMGYMFAECESLKTLDISSLISARYINMVLILSWIRLGCQTCSR